MGPGGRFSIGLVGGLVVIGLLGLFHESRPNRTGAPASQNRPGYSSLGAWRPSAPYKKKSPALLGPGFPDPNAYETFFSFRLRHLL